MITWSNQIWFRNWTKCLIINVFSVFFPRSRNKKQTVLLNPVCRFLVVQSKKSPAAFMTVKSNKILFLAELPEGRKPFPAVERL